MKQIVNARSHKLYPYLLNFCLVFKKKKNEKINMPIKCIIQFRADNYNKCENDYLRDKNIHSYFMILIFLLLVTIVCCKCYKPFIIVYK